ncbi:MAG TPA: mechanosensitive ion channel domain-containing protein [candidate division Zixibacteria bacterium]|nr:mechanosensitive ion channel domain-containing protein [candidate division Zixibacteria bacterium]
MGNLENTLFNPTVDKIILVVVGFLIIYLVVRFLQRSTAHRVKEVENRYRMRKSLAFLGYLAAILFAIAILGNQLSGFSVMLGVMAAGIAFALQEVIASVAGWLALTFSSFYRVGDRVQLGGIKGDVIDIGVLRTTLMECGEWIDSDLYSGRIVRIANSFVFKEPVFNYSADFHFLWDEISIPIKYGGSRHLALEILQRVANELAGEYAAEAEKVWQHLMENYMIVAAQTAPTVTLVANDNWLEYTVRYVVKYTERRSMKSQLFNRIMDEIDQTNGQVAIASTTIHIVDAPTFDVQLKGGSNVLET